MLKPMIRRPLGFTLIEILVVCAIMAILLGLAVARFDRSDARQLDHESEKLALMLEAARDNAVISGRNIAFSSDTRGYHFWIADPDKNEWLDLPPSDTIKPQMLPDNLSLTTLRINGGLRPLGERVVFLPSGISEPFSISLEASKAKKEIVVDVMGRIEVRNAQQ